MFVVRHENHFFQPLVRRGILIWSTTMSKFSVCVCERDTQGDGYASAMCICTRTDSFKQLDDGRSRGGVRGRNDRGGTPVSGFMADAAQWKVPFLVSDSFSHCQGQPHPTLVIPQSCDQTSWCNSLRREVDLIQLWKSVTGGPGLVFLLYFLFVKERKRENKTQENQLSLSVPPIPFSFPSTLIPISLYFTLSVGIELFVQLPLID